MIAKEKFMCLLLQILFFAIIYMFLNDSHFSGINRLEEMIRTEVLQRKIDPIVKKEILETFKLSEKKKEIKEIQKKTEEIKTDLEKEKVIVNLAKPSFFDRFFKRLYFSFVTGTTLGYGDIFPSSTICKTMTIIQLTATILLIIV